MRLKIIAVYDSGVEAYFTPQFYRSRGEAIRSFTEAVHDSKSNISKYPSAFTMFELGEWDDQTAVITLHKTPITYGLAIEYLKQDSGELLTKAS